MKLICPNCGREGNIPNVEKYKGKKIIVTCKNKVCGMKFSKKIPDVEETSTFIISEEVRRFDARLSRMNGSGAYDTTEMIREGINYVGRYPKGEGHLIVFSGDVHMSRTHCIIRAYRRQESNELMCVLSDNDSGNGVMVNGSKISPEDKIILVDQDVIILGETKFLFELI